MLVTRQRRVKAAGGIGLLMADLKTGVFRMDVCWVCSRPFFECFGRRWQLHLSSICERKKMLGNTFQRTGKSKIVLMFYSVLAIMAASMS